MPIIESSLIGAWVGSYLLPLFRIASFFLAAPVIGTKLVPTRIRIILSLLVTAVLAPHLPAMPQFDAISVASMVLVAQQVLIGLAMGFSLQMLLQLFVVAGQMIAMQMGLGFASMVDPSNGVSVPVVSQFHLMLVTLLFLALNGHLAMIEVLATSFYTLPVGSGFITGNALWELISWASWMFGSALLIALPAVASLLIINCSMGVVTRAAPQLNIFAVGFPSMLVIGLCILWLMSAGYLALFDQLTQQALETLASLVRR